MRLRRPKYLRLTTRVLSVLHDVCLTMKTQKKKLRNPGRHHGISLMRRKQMLSGSFAERRLVDRVTRWRVGYCRGAVARQSRLGSNRPRGSSSNSDTLVLMINTEAISNSYSPDGLPRSAIRKIAMPKRSCETRTILPRKGVK